MQSPEVDTSVINNEVTFTKPNGLRHNKLVFRERRATHLRNGPKGHGVHDFDGPDGNLGFEGAEEWRLQLDNNPLQKAAKLPRGWVSR
jgi:hypothetical protein